jgi:hypothetical protein
VLPYNFPKLLPLIKQAVDAIKTIPLPSNNDTQNPSNSTTENKSKLEYTTAVKQLFSQAWAQAWRNEMLIYFQTLPSYYYSSIKALLKRFSLLPFVPLTNFEFNLNSNTIKSIVKFQEQSTYDVAAQEAVARARRDTMAKSIVSRVGASKVILNYTISLLTG